VSDGLFAHEEGNGEPAIVLLHGFGSTHRAWRQVQPALARERAVLAVDLPGHGASLHHAGGDSPRAAAEAVADLIRARAGGAVHLAGHSMGGAVAMLVAMSAPELVASLTLLAPGGLGPEINHRLLARYAAAQDRGELLAVLEMMCGWNHGISAQTVDDYAAMRSLPGQAERLRAMAAAMVRDGRQGVIGRDRLERLEMPVSIAWGLQDCVLPPRQLEGLPPAFAMHIFEEAGHMLPVERPDGIVRLIRRNVTIR